MNFVDRTLTAFVVQDDSDSEQDQIVPPRIPDEPPIVVMAAHNGYDLFIGDVCVCAYPWRRAVHCARRRILAFTQVSL